MGIKNHENNKIVKKVNEFFTERIKTFGQTPKGVDWKDSKSQYLRFKVLSNVITKQNNFSINDIGCGYGLYYEYLKNENKYTNFKYRGYDISEEMIRQATQRYNLNNLFFHINSINIIKSADFTIASGLFNMKLHLKNVIWLEYVLEHIKIIAKKSKKGFAFNILTKYSDKEFMRPDLYYADPCFMFDYCKKIFPEMLAYFTITIYMNLL